MVFNGGTMGWMGVVDGNPAVIGARSTRRSWAETQLWHFLHRLREMYTKAHRRFHLEMPQNFERVRVKLKILNLETEWMGMPWAQQGKVWTETGQRQQMMRVSCGHIQSEARAQFPVGACLVGRCKCRGPGSHLHLRKDKETRKSALSRQLTRIWGWGSS